MPSTVAQLAERVVRKLGIAVVLEADRPASGPVVGQAEIASRALRAVGVNPAVLTPGIGGAGTLTLAAIATAALRKLAVVDSEEQPTATDQAEAVARATAVHEILVANDFVTWSGSAIPLRATEYYIIMTANLLAPQFGKPASMEAFTAAQGAIRVQALSGAAGQALAEAKVKKVHEELNAAGLVSWAVTAVPLGQVQDYVAMTASLLAPIYSFQQDAPGRETSAKQWAEAFARIRRAAIVRNAVPLASDKIMAVHQDWAARGRTRWTIWDVPFYAEEPYVLLAATLMGPECDVKVDPAWAVQAERTLAQVIALGTSGQRVIAEYF